MLKNVNDRAGFAVPGLTDVLPVAGKTSSFKDKALSFQDDELGKFIYGLENQTPEGEASNTDLRVRLRPMNFDQVLGVGSEEDNILAILKDTNGLLFPYTPSIDWNQSVEYTTTSLTHTNQDYQIYKNTPSSIINITGRFTVQNAREAQYMMAVFHFLRVVSKMHFGRQSEQPGMPPPVLLLSGYGDYMFNDLPVIVKNHSYNLPEDGHTVPITIAGSTVRVPVLATITISLVVQNTPKRLRDEFNLEEFRTGRLMKDGGWI
jgi:hypothetical protein